MFLEDCPEGVAYEVEFLGVVDYRWRDGRTVRLASPTGQLLSRQTCENIDWNMLKTYRVIRKVFREDGDD